MNDPQTNHVVLVLESPTGKPGRIAAALGQEPGLTVVSCMGEEDLAHQAHRYGSAMVVVDASNPEIDSDEAIRGMAKKYRAGRFPALVAMLGEDGRESRARLLLELGATDVLPIEAPPVFLATRVRSVIRTKQLHDDLAESLQDLARTRDAVATALQSLLPAEIPSVPGWDIDRRIDVARNRAGDLHDVFALPDGRFALMVADALGSGLDNLGPMAMLRGVVRCGLMEGESPAAILAKVNRALGSMYESEVVLSATVIVANPADGRMTMAVAGGCQPMVATTPNAKAHWEGSASGPPLGVDPDAEFQEAEVVVDAGGWMLLATNGSYQLYNAAGELLGADGFETLAADLGGGSGEQLLENLANAIRAFDKEKQARDDCTLVLAMRHRAPGDN